MSEAESALFEEPFQYCLREIKPDRDKNRRKWRRIHWWYFGEVMPKMRSNALNKARYIATSLTAKHRCFSWIQIPTICDSTTVVIAADDDLTFGILHSRFHQLWYLRMCTWLGAGNDPRYTPTTCFETFPFPEGLTPITPVADYENDQRAQAIALAAVRLNELRENWLNPEDLVERVPEVVEGYPDRIVPKDEKAEKTLKKRTLTNLYNERPAWLDHAHTDLDEAVAAAYDWPVELTDEEILERLFHLNQERVAAEKQ